MALNTRGTFLRPSGAPGELHQRKLAAMSDIQRLTEVVRSVQRKLAAGSDAVSAKALEERQLELHRAHVELHDLLADEVAGCGSTLEKLVEAKRTSENAREPLVVSTARAPARSAPPAKYRDPKTGATWSGRGRAPGWIAKAKSRDKFLIEQPQNTG